MVALDWYYNNGSKVIDACMREFKALPSITTGDYEALVVYKMCIIKNHSRHLLHKKIITIVASYKANLVCNLSPEDIFE